MNYNPDIKYSPSLESAKLRPSIRTVLEGTPFIETLQSGNLNFLYAFNGEWIKLNVNSEDELRVAKIGIGLGQTDPIPYELTLADGKQFGHPSYSAGSYKFDGVGFIFDYDNKFAGKSYLELDNMLVRGNLTVFDLLIIQKRFTNGSLFISNGAKVSAVNGTTITFEDPTKLGACPFAAGDLIFTIRFRMDSTTVMKSCYATVSSVLGNSAVVSYTSGTFEVGDEVARVGNTTDATRQGMVYLTADDTTAPFLDIVSGVNSWVAWNSTNKVVARLGRLKDLPTTSFGTLPDVVGLYLKNNIYLDDGNINMGTTGYIRGGLTSYSDTGHTGFWLGYDSTTYKFKIYNSATKYLIYDGTDFNLTGGYISAGAVRSTGTMTYDRAVAGTEFGYWLGKYGTNDYRFFIGSSATKQLKYDNSDLTMIGGTVTGGTIQTAASGTRAVLSGTTNDLRYYDSSGQQAKFGTVVTSLYGMRAHSTQTTYGAVIIDDGDISTNVIGDLSIVLEVIPTTGSRNASCVVSDAVSGAAFGYNTSTNILYTYGSLFIGTSSVFPYPTPFVVNSSGQLTTVNSLAASGYTGYVLGSDGTSYTPLGLTANDFNYSAGVISIDYTNGQAASGSTKGFLTSTDWTTFNGKESALTFSSPLSRSTNTISIPVATSSANGYLSSTDWSTFNGKSTVSMGSESLLRTISIGASNIYVYASTLTINGTGYQVITDTTSSPK